jgi:hypothetical protein
MSTAEIVKHKKILFLMQKFRVGKNIKSEKIHVVDLPSSLLFCCKVLELTLVYAKFQSSGYFSSLLTKITKLVYLAILLCTLRQFYTKRVSFAINSPSVLIGPVPAFCCYVMWKMDEVHFKPECFMKIAGSGCLPG